MMVYTQNAKIPLTVEDTTVGSIGAAGTVFYMSASKSITNRVVSIGNGKVLRFTDEGYVIETGVTNSAGSISPDGNHIGHTYYDSSRYTLTSGHYAGNATWRLDTETLPKPPIAVNWFDGNTKLYTHDTEIPFFLINGIRTNLGSVAIANPYARFDTALTTVLLVGHYHAATVFQSNAGAWGAGTTLPGTKPLTFLGADMSADGRVIAHPLTNGGVGIFARNEQMGYTLVQTLANASAAGISADGKVVAVTVSGGYARVYTRNADGTYELTKTSVHQNVVATYPSICVEPQGQYVMMSATSGFVVLQS